MNEIEKKNLKYKSSGPACFSNSSSYDEVETKKRTCLFPSMSRLLVCQSAPNEGEEFFLFFFFFWVENFLVSRLLSHTVYSSQRR